MAGDRALLEHGLLEIADVVDRDGLPGALPAAQQACLPFPRAARGEPDIYPAVGMRAAGPDLVARPFEQGLDHRLEAMLGNPPQQA